MGYSPRILRSDWLGLNLNVYYSNRMEEVYFEKWRDQVPNGKTTRVQLKYESMVQWMCIRMVSVNTLTLSKGDNRMRTLVTMPH